jgi:hypothetical protein
MAKAEDQAEAAAAAAARAAVLERARPILAEVAAGTKVMDALSLSENRVLAAALVVLIDDARERK